MIYTYALFADAEKSKTSPQLLSPLILLMHLYFIYTSFPLQPNADAQSRFYIHIQPVCTSPY